MGALTDCERIATFIGETWEPKKGIAPELIKIMSVSLNDNAVHQRQTN
jgi:hypothetical protein